ncbi:MAG: hypothetical protein M1274_11225 [Actinobacteria bacterium]|nr:hypothetical protein [Actinomycetota bacterium]
MTWIPTHGTAHSLAQIAAVPGRAVRLTTITTLELGTRQGKSFATDPNGLITREEIFHNADSILAAGLLP